MRVSQSSERSLTNRGSIISPFDGSIVVPWSCILAREVTSGIKLVIRLRNYKEWCFHKSHNELLNRIKAGPIFHSILILYCSNNLGSAIYGIVLRRSVYQVSFHLSSVSWTGWLVFPLYCHYVWKSAALPERNKVLGSGQYYEIPVVSDTWLHSMSYEQPKSAYPGG